MTHMRHNNRANALCLVVCLNLQVGGGSSRQERRYRASTGPQGTVDCQRRGDIVEVLLELAAVDVNVVVTHASAKSYATQAAKAAGCGEG